MASVKKQIGRLIHQAADRKAVRAELLAYLAAVGRPDNGSA
ncbi:hypothetical protein VH569_31910 [Azospirillum sp. 11R-A]